MMQGQKTSATVPVQAAPAAAARPAVVTPADGTVPLPLPTPVVPYATPVGLAPRDELQVAWRGKELIIPDGGSIADRCIRCNEPGDGRPIKRQLSWHPSALFLLILFPGLIIYLIVALIVRKRATIYVGLCARHRRGRRTLIATAWGTFFAAIGAFFLASQFRDESVSFTLVLLGGLGILGSIVMGALASQQLGYPSRIRPPFVWLKNVNRQYPAPA